MKSRQWFGVGVAAAGAAVIGIEVSIYLAIRRTARTDNARPAGAIVVFGAAEYDGRPSPVFKARLDHALDLARRGVAPWVVVSGGSGGDPHFTEGGVGKAYLIRKGLSARQVIAETRSSTTYQSVVAIAPILRALHAKDCIAVSDGFHLYRVKLLMRAQGILTYTSPAPKSVIESDPSARVVYSLRELVLVDLLYLGIHV